MSLGRLRASGLSVAAVLGTRSPLTRTEEGARVRAVGGAVLELDAAHHPHLSHPAEVAGVVVAMGARGSTAPETD